MKWELNDERAGTLRNAIVAYFEAGASHVIRESE
jgi:hypothetical protein